MHLYVFLIVDSVACTATFIFRSGFCAMEASIFVYVCMCVCVCVCMCVYVCMCVVCMCMRVYVCVCVYVCWRCAYEYV